MARSQFIVLVLLLAAAGAWFAVWMRRRPAREPHGSTSPSRLPPNMFSGTPSQAAAEQLCQLGARSLDAHLALFLRQEEGISLVAYAPRRPQLEILEKVAAEWALAHCVPTGRGTGLMAASEWQFQPVFQHGQLLGLLALAGRGGREPAPQEKIWLVEDVLRLGGKVLAEMTDAPSKPLDRPLLFA